MIKFWPRGVSVHQQEDALKHLMTAEDLGHPATDESLAGYLETKRSRAVSVLKSLRDNGWAVVDGPTHRLTQSGRFQALQIIRGHRLVETWLARETGALPTTWHRIAHRQEHRLDAQGMNELADRLGNPRFDPHGDPIPTRDGALPVQKRTALSSWKDGRSGRIAHLEDEPEDLFAQADAMGIAPGMWLSDPHHDHQGSVACHLDGRPVTIPGAVTQIIHLFDESIAPPVPTVATSLLSELPIGVEAVVDGLSPACVGPQRLRLLDLGIVPGTPIRCEFTSPFGTPRSYLVRGALIALRDSQAALVRIRKPSPAP